MIECVLCCKKPCACTLAFLKDSIEQAEQAFDNALSVEEGALSARRVKLLKAALWCMERGSFARHVALWTKA